MGLSKFKLAPQPVQTSFRPSCRVAHFCNDWRLGKPDLIEDQSSDFSQFASRKAFG